MPTYPAMPSKPARPPSRRGAGPTLPGIAIIGATPSVLLPASDAACITFQAAVEFETLWMLLQQATRLCVCRFPEARGPAPTLITHSVPEIPHAQPYAGLAETSQLQSSHVSVEITDSRGKRGVGSCRGTSPSHPFRSRWAAGDPLGPQSGPRERPCQPVRYWTGF